jgi:RHS repeat-associated protein
MSTNTYQYTGRVNDGTGLYYYRARYYSPRFQRFISEDPAGFAGGQTNLYSYTSNSPTNLNDPTGHYGLEWHFYITYTAAVQAGWSPEDALDLAARTAGVDIGSQDPGAAMANMHAMSGRKPNGKMQNCSQAYNGAQKQFESDLQSSSMEGLAKALHMIQDATAPAHAGFQPWNGGWGDHCTYLGFLTSYLIISVCRRALSKMQWLVQKILFET